MDSVRYAAFISYSSQDAHFVARLHRALEQYKIPRSLGEFRLSDHAQSLNRIYPVFRDRSELASGQLESAIERSLNDSGALIVVCSPAAANSAFVAKEIEAFEKTGRADRIFAIIVGGTPHASENGDAAEECFPPALRRNARQERGLPEVLAADARADKDGFRPAWLKLVAGLIGQPLGALIDRDRSRRFRTGAMWGAAAALLVAAIGFGGVQIYQADSGRRAAQLQERTTQARQQFTHMRSLLIAERSGEALLMSRQIEAALLPPEDQAALQQTLLFWGDVVMTPPEVARSFPSGRVFEFNDQWFVRVRGAFVRVPNVDDRNGDVERIRLPAARFMIRRTSGWGGERPMIVDLETGAITQTVENERRSAFGPLNNGALIVGPWWFTGRSSPSEHHAQIRFFNGQVLPETPAPLLPSLQFLIQDCSAVIWIGTPGQTIEAFYRANVSDLPAGWTADRTPPRSVINVLVQVNPRLLSVESANDDRVRRYTFDAHGISVVVTAASLSEAPLSHDRFPTGPADLVTSLTLLTQLTLYAQEARYDSFALQCVPRWENRVYTSRPELSAPIYRNAWTRADWSPSIARSEEPSVLRDVTSATGERLRITVSDRENRRDPADLQSCLSTGQSPARCRSRTIVGDIKASLPRSGVIFIETDPPESVRSALDLRTLEPVAIPRSPHDFAFEAQFLTETPSNQIVAVGGNLDRLIILARQGQRLVVQREISPIPGGIEGIFAPTANLLLMLSNNTMYGLDLRTGAVVWNANLGLIYDQRDEQFYPVFTASPDGRLLLIVRSNREARIFQLPSGAPLTPWEHLVELVLDENPSPWTSGVLDLSIDNAGRIVIRREDGLHIRAAPRNRPQGEWRTECALGFRERGARDFDPMSAADAQGCGYGPLASALRQAAASGRAPFDAR